MAKLKMKISPDGDSFEVANMCNPNNPTQCVGEFKNLLGEVAEFSESEVEHTNEYFVAEEMPPQLEEVDS